MVRALDRQGLRVAFVKPIANRETNQSSDLVALGGAPVAAGVDSQPRG
jgi:BioD-like phosphotransacetylase family protein